MPESLFITGTQRCGTTLLEKLLCGHPRLSVLSQPLPLLFVETKRAFLATRGLRSDPYPLGTLFRERRYRAADFARYLDAWSMTRAQLLALAARMEEYSGQYTRFGRERWADALTLPCSGFAASLGPWLRALGHRDQADCWGAKESCCEEYVPHLLRHGFACILVLRDPRAVLASVSHGDFRAHAGRLKPTLFNVRLWRKSVAFALHFQRHPGCRVVRYEDLVADPRRTATEVAGWLGVGPFPDEPLRHWARDQSGQPWRGNSSFGPIEGVSSRESRPALSPEVSRFVAASCGPEMECLGYSSDLSPDEVPSILLGFRDPYPVEREELRGYVDNPDELREELERWRLVHGGEPRDSRGHFIFPDVQRRLQAAVREAAG